MTELPEAPLGEAERRSREPFVNWRDPERPPEPELEIYVTTENIEQVAVREGVHERIQAEILHGDKEAESTAEEMIEVPPEWNEVPDLMMEEEDFRPATVGATKQKRDEVAGGGENGRKKTISALRNMHIRPQCPRGHRIQEDSILKIGMKFSRKKTNGRH